MRADGHRVTLPDLFDGATSESVEGGFAIQERVGWETMMARARAAAEPLPAETALAGVSAGAQVAGTLWLERPAAEGCSCCMGRARSGRRVEAHLAEPEPYDDEDYLQWWAEGMRSAGLDFTLYRYPGAGHYFTDPSLPDHDAAAAALAVERALAFLRGLDALGTGPGGGTANP